MIRYTLRPDAVEENLELLADVQLELTENQPEVVKMATFQLDDKVSFVHLHAADRPARLHTIKSFERFRRSLPERCVAEPMSTEVDCVGLFNFG
jgi:hypothetical protein